MARYEFGAADPEDDVLVLQGIEYPMQPAGWKAQKALLGVVKQQSDDPVEQVEAAIDLILAAVVPESREALRQHIEDRVDPGTIVQMVTRLQRTQVDVDPTLLASLPAGSLPNGSGSTAGAPPAASTPSNSPTGA